MNKKYLLTIVAFVCLVILGSFLFIRDKAVNSISDEDKGIESTTTTQRLTSDQSHVSSKEALEGVATSTTPDTVKVPTNGVSSEIPIIHIVGEIVGVEDQSQTMSGHLYVFKDMDAGVNLGEIKLDPAECGTTLKNWSHYVINVTYNSQNLWYECISAGELSPQISQ